MIFQHTWQSVLSGEKTQTRRLVKVGETLTRRHPPYIDMDTVHSKNSHIVYRVGKTYAVQPARTKPAIWWHISDKGLLETVDGVICYRPTQTEDGTDYDILTRIDGRAFWQERGFKQARIRITDIRREDVRRISEADAIAEGFQNREGFWDTWVSMHDKRWLDTYRYAADCDYLDEYGFFKRPEERYDAWALTFELVKE